MIQETRTGLGPEVNARNAELDGMITSEFAHLGISNAGKIKPGRDGVVSYLDVLDAQIRITPGTRENPISLMEAATRILEEIDARPTNVARIVGLLVLRHGVETFAPRFPRQC